MKRLAFTLAAIGFLSGAAVASVEGKRIEHRPYAYLDTPPEATMAAMGGPGVVLVDKVKSTVRIEFTGGAPCGPRREPDAKPFNSGGSSGGSPNDESDGTGLWLPVGIGVAAVGVIAVVGYFLLRQSPA